MAADVRKANAKWWVSLETGQPIERNKGELLMLVITELAEAVEGIRKNLMDDKLPNRRMEEVEMADAFIRLLDFAGGFGITIPEFTPKPSSDPLDKPEWAKSDNKAEQILGICRMVQMIHAHTTSSLWRLSGRSMGLALENIRRYCHHHNLDLMGAYAAKMEYNRTRADHKHEARRGDNGKKF